MEKDTGKIENYEVIDIWDEIPEIVKEVIEDYKKLNEIKIRGMPKDFRGWSAWKEAKFNPDNLNPQDFKEYVKLNEKIEKMINKKEFPKIQDLFNDISGGDYLNNLNINHVLNACGGRDNVWSDKPVIQREFSGNGFCFSAGKNTFLSIDKELLIYTLNNKIYKKIMEISSDPKKAPSNLKKGLDNMFSKEDKAYDISYFGQKRKNDIVNFVEDNRNFINAYCILNKLPLYTNGSEGGLFYLDFGEGNLKEYKGYSWSNIAEKVIDLKNGKMYKYAEKLKNQSS